jgi:hypothetical protein
VVGDVKSSRQLFDGVRADGGRAVMGPSGYVLMRDVMLAERAALACPLPHDELTVSPKTTSFMGGIPERACSWLNPNSDNGCSFHGGGA